MDSLAGLRLAAYARFSSENQRDRSIEDQVRLCRDTAERNDGTIPEDRVFTDYAVSGSSNTRAGLDRLLRLIETRAVDVVLTESSDRLTRDMGDADRLWKQCRFHNVRLLCVSDGIDSKHRGSRIQFGVKALMADEYLDDLREKTYRGLRGAALNGFSTGGLPYGYTSRPILNGGREPDAFEILIAPEQAAVVVRIFEMYRDGYSYLTIATKLNDEGVPPPRFQSRKHPSKFWKKGTIREMLRNPAYMGRWTFGKKQWRKDPTTRKRRYVKRAPHDVHESDRPHLRIVQDDLWEAVRERRNEVRNNYAGKGSGAPGHRTHRPLSGLLFCGLCGHRMVDAGGSTSRYYRCSAATTGGACSNKQKVREDVLVAAAVEELKRLLFDTDLRERLREKIEQKIAKYRSRSGTEKRALEKELTRLEAETERLVSFIRTTDITSSPGAFEAVRASLEKATNQQRDMKAKLAALSSDAAEPRLPTVDEIMAYVLDVETRIKDDPTTAREALRQVLVSGKITLTPEADGACKAESMLIIGRLTWKTRKPRKTESSEAFKVVEIGSCAGRI